MDNLFIKYKVNIRSTCVDNIFWYLKWYENIEITLQKKLRYWFHIIFFGAVYNKEGIFKIQEYMQESSLLNIWIVIELWILIKMTG